MEQRKLHANGPLCSRIICGAWRWHTISHEQLDRLVQTALDAGIRSFDHADVYGDHSNEELFGQVLRRNPGLRKGMQLITKCGVKFPSTRRPSTRVKHYDTSSKHIIWSVENSLKMLNTDVLDLLLIHRPDPLMDPHEVAEALSSLRSDGKLLHAGVSNFTISQFRMLQSYLSFPLVTNQIEISLSRLDPFFNGDLDFLMEQRVSPMAWSPLGGGKTISADEREVFQMASKYNGTYSQLSLAWIMKHPSTIFPVIGTTKPERIIEAAGSFDIQIDRQDWFGILKWVTGKDVA
ncbi:MAG: aldo/keto reductase [Cyclobacteriaceae bacterium]|nr:aldo/keto reductase [Cyclobacteriaceae bacterium]